MNVHREACEGFHHYAGKELILLYYEDYNSWVDRQTKGMNI